MSKTDNTQPYWVKLAQNPQERVEYHDHCSRVCDIEDYPWKMQRSLYDWRLQHCYYKIKVNEYWIFNGRPHVKNYRPYHVKHERAEIRLKIRDLIKMSFEDIYDDEFGNYQHRHSALWEAW